MKKMNGKDNTESQNRCNTDFCPENKNYSRSFIVLSSVAFLLYVFIIVLMLRNWKLCWRPANEFLVNLLISDGIVCIVFISYAGVLLAIWSDEKSFFGNNFRLPTLEVVFHVIVVSSMLNFTLITVDLLIAVKCPFLFEDNSYQTVIHWYYCGLGYHYSISNGLDYTSHCVWYWNLVIFSKDHIYCCSYNRFYHLFIKFLCFCKSKEPINSNSKNHSQYTRHLKRAHWQIN